jgi:hypothetical protein
MSSALRWARADARDVVELTPRKRSGRQAPSTSSFAARLNRWRTRIALHRAVAIIRRHLLVLLGVVLVAEIIVTVTGSKGHPPAWLLAPLLLALIDGAVVLARSIPAPRAAQMLDSELGLHERVGTALELQASKIAPHGLGAMVVNEANTALRDSLGSAHAVGRGGSRREWGLLLALIAALVAVAVVPWHSTNTTRSGHTAGLAGKSSGSGGTAPASGSSRSVAGSKNGSSLKGAPKLPSGRGLQGGIANTSSHAAQGDDYNIYGNGGHLTAKQLTQLAHQGIAGSGSTAGVGGSTAQAGAGASNTGGNNPSSGGATGGGASAISKGTQGLAGGALSAPTSSSAAGGASAPGAAGSGKAKAGASGVSPSAAGGYQKGSGGAPSGGETAGSSLAANLAGNSLTPNLNGNTSLPLQAGYSPFGSKHTSSNEGTSVTPNGGGGPSRTAQAGGSGNSSSTSGLTLIPPTTNAASTTSAGLQQGYFGSANQLEFSGW